MTLEQVRCAMAKTARDPSRPQLAQGLDLRTDRCQAYLSVLRHSTRCWDEFHIDRWK
jgi:hypothetical protein